MQDVFRRVSELLDNEVFQIPNNQSVDSFFPDYFKKMLNRYLDYYKNFLEKHIMEIPFDKGSGEDITQKILHLTKSLTSTIDLYYSGRVFEASNKFRNALENLIFNNIKPIASIDPKKSFYRARTACEKRLFASNMFHIDFNMRHLVGTNRYSVPGFPALYMGDSTYVCWEEANRYRLRDMWFARFENQRGLFIIQLQRVQDFLKELEDQNEDNKITFLLRYLVLFPLTLACTVRVKEPTGHFKPEYIISQLLLEYISTNENIDGIKFPSTKVDYNTIYDVDAYNYVFPVKKVSSKGICPILAQTFYLTDPTSLELEEIRYNPTISEVYIGSGRNQDMRKIELIGGQQDFYSTTSFGKIESSLLNKKLVNLYPAHI